MKLLIQNLAGWFSIGHDFYFWGGGPQ